MATYKTNPVKIIDENTVLVTKAFAKQARIFGTPEYKKWKEIKADLPAAKMVTKKIKKNPEKKTNRNKTYENMKLFIEQQKNAEELLKEFERQKKSSKVTPSPYTAVLEWFEDTFKDYPDYQHLFDEKSVEKNDQAEEKNEQIEEKAEGFIERDASVKKVEKAAA